MAVKSLKRAQERIEIKDLKLNALLEVSLAINDLLPKKELFQIYVNTLRKLNIEKLALLIHDKKWEWAISFGVKDGDLEFDAEKELTHFTEITEVNYSKSEALKAFDLLIPVYHQTQPIAFLLIGDIVNEAIKISPIIKHLNFIQTFTNIIAVAIENQRLAEEAILQERTKKELEMASEMQNMFLPKTFPNTEKLKISAYYKSHQKIGGDYYDVIPLDDERCAFCIADVSGKGVAAALLMSNFQANLRALSKYCNSLEELVQLLNTKVLENAKGDRFITFFIAIYHRNTHFLEYVNCGHNPPILLMDHNIHLLKKGSVGLGMLDEIPVLLKGEIQLKGKGRLLAYTDGLTEVENADLEEFGEERVMEILQKNPSLNNSDIIELMIQQIEDFKKDKPMVDDIAMLCCTLG